MRTKFWLTMIPLFMQGLPIGMEIAKGDCQVSAEGLKMSLHAADQTVLNWSDFSIRSDESIQFFMPDAKSVVLNRVIGQNPSTILGDLFCNGKLILMNPNGILFGEKCSVNVQALTASTLDLQSEVFGKGKIEVGGSIYAPSGEIFLKGSEVSVCAGAQINADALMHGNGGKITIFGDRFAQMAGHLSALGGELSGDGGKIELSTQGQLEFTGTVSTLALHGSTGDFIIDPLDLTVIAPNFNVTGATPFTPTGAGATLDPATVVAALAGSNVTITTVGTVGAAAGDINIVSPITGAWTNSLTISADGAIQIADGIVVGSTGANANITLTANGNINVFGAVRNSEFATSTGAAINITSFGGTISIGRAGSLTSPSGAVANIFGAINIRAPRGNVNLLGGTALNSYAIIGNDNNFFTTANALSSGDILIEAQNFTMQAGSNTSTLVSVSRLPVPPLTTAPMTNNAAGNITINAAQDVTIQTGTAGLIGGRTDGAFIGHGNGGGYSGANTARSRVGNILINTGRNLNMINTRFSNLVITGDPTGIASIGTNRVTSAVLGHSGTITLNVGNDLNMFGLPNSGRLNGTSIGTSSTSLIADTRNYQVPIYINVGRDFCMDGRLSLAVLGTHNNGSQPAFPTEFFIHVGRNFSVIAGNAARPGSGNLGGAFAFIRHLPSATTMRYQVWVGGSLVCLNGNNLATGGFAEIHIPSSYQAAAAIQRVLYDTSIRTGGDLRVAGGFAQAGVTYSSTGAIFYEADSAFAQGELWPALNAIVDGVNVFAGTPLGTASPAQARDGMGAIAFDFQRYDNSGYSCQTLMGNVPDPDFPVTIPIVYQAHFGQDITMLTTDRFVDGTPADFTTGTGVGEISFNNSIRTTVQQNSLNVPGANIRIVNFRNTTITGASLTSPAGNVLVVTNNDMSLINNANITASGLVTLVSDNQAPFPPLLGPGSFTIDNTSQINSGPGQAIRIFTAIPEQNSISLLALINGQTIGNIATSFGITDFPGNPYLTDNFLETWCIYYNVPPGNIYVGSPRIGIPFMIFYKPCLQVLAEQAMEVINQLLVDLHPYNEYPGWMQKFWVKWKGYDSYHDLPYYLRRRHLNHLNHPKSYTVYMLP